MEIKYLPLLEEHVTLTQRGTNKVFKREPLSIEEIERLEKLYNDGKPFPIALRELLYLAGKFCYGISQYPSQQGMQEKAKEVLAEPYITMSIQRPFYVFCNGVEWYDFLLIYLDEAVEDPIVYYAQPDFELIDSKEIKLSTFIYTAIGETIRGNHWW